MPSVNFPLILTTLGLAALLLFGSANASEVQHFKGQPSDTLEQAVSNFSQYNSKLAVILDAELDARALYEIHELTYTLEVALEKINTELQELADVLEEVHLATERNDAQTTRARGMEYLTVSRQVVR